MRFYPMAGLAWVAIIFLWLIGAAALFGIVYAAVRLAALSALKAHTRWQNAGQPGGGARSDRPAVQHPYPGAQPPPYPAAAQPPYPGAQPQHPAAQAQYPGAQPQYPGAQPPGSPDTYPTVPLPPPDGGAPPAPRP